jgi:hypothetical protein
VPCISFFLLTCIASFIVFFKIKEPIKKNIKASGAGMMNTYGLLFIEASKKDTFFFFYSLHQPHQKRRILINRKLALVEG